jgi:DNA-binding PadR family transcriptional regulator
MATSLTPVELQILLALANTSRHGYGIKLDIEDRTAGAVKLGSGTLYEAIQRMRKNDWLEVADPPGNDSADTRRKYYRLTPDGRSRLQQDLESLQGIVADAIAMDMLPETKPA